MISKNRHTLALLATLAYLAPATVAHANATAQPPAATHAPLAKIMESLADTRAFRLTSAQFDQVVAPYCQQTKRKADRYSVVARYRCDASTGISVIKIDSRENAKSPSKHMMYVTMFLSADRFAPLKAQMLAKLGKPKKNDKDSLYWTYTADKELNRYGNPSFTLSRDTSDDSTTFQLALEQGP